LIALTLALVAIAGVLVSRDRRVLYGSSSVSQYK
jgi:hypothetical protein